MKTQVPEDGKLVGLSDILGRKELHDLRGKLPQGLIDFWEEILFEKDSRFHGKTPSQVMQKFTRLVSKMNSLVNLSAQLVRQGDDDLARSMLRSLSRDRKDYRLPAEVQDQDIDPAKTIPITLFMIDPEKTKVLLEWFSKNGYISSLLKEPFGTGNFTDSTKQKIDEQIKLNQLLLETYPSLSRFLEMGRSIRDFRESNYYFQEGYPLQLAQLTDAVLPQISSLQKLHDRCWDPDLVNRIRRVCITAHRLSNHRNQEECQWHCLCHSNRSFELVHETAKEKKLPARGGFFSSAFLYLAYGVQQSDVLNCFPDEMRQKLATWQFRLPISQVYKNLLSSLAIGLHDVSVHPHWTERWPLFASKGTSHGYGGLILPLVSYWEGKLYEEVLSDYIRLHYSWRQGMAPAYHVFKCT